MNKQRIAVIGSGVMGAQIAQVLAVSGYGVVLHDITEQALVNARRTIDEGPFGIRASVARGKLSEASRAEALERIRTTTDLASACGDVDLLIETVPEDLALKMKLFRSADRLSPEHTVLASNTAGLPITALAHATNRPAKVIGWHWAQPCAVMRLAEIIVHPETEKAAVDLVTEIAAKCGKNPLVIKDQPFAWGFVANRLNAAVHREADRIVAEGVATPKQVDQLIRDCFRWPLGPFENRGLVTD